MTQTLKKILYLLSSNERKKMSLLIIMIVIMALLEMIGVASIMPFLIVLADPEIIKTNALLKTMFHIAAIFGVETNQQFIFALGILVFILLSVSLSFKGLTFYLQQRFITMREYNA